MPALAFGSALVFFFGQEIAIYLLYQPLDLAPVERFPSNLVVPLLAGCIVCFLFWELEGHSKNDLSTLVETDPWRRWFWWGFGSGVLITILTLILVGIASFLIPWLSGFDDPLAIWGVSGFVGVIIFSVWIRSRLIEKLTPTAMAQQTGDGNSG